MTHTALCRAISSTAAGSCYAVDNVENLLLVDITEASARLVRLRLLLLICNPKGP